MNDCEIATCVLLAAESSGQNDDACEAVCVKLSSVIEECVESGETIRLSDGRKAAARILACAYPSYAGFFLEPFSAGTSTTRECILSRADAIRMILGDVLSGVECFDQVAIRKAGASKLLAYCPSPLPIPNTPFDDDDPYKVIED